MNFYVHVPFCVRKCNYCSFYSEPIEPICNYSKLILDEARCRLCHKDSWQGVDTATRYDTLYFGGGTPSLLDEHEIKNIILGLKEYCDFDEVTIEVNPGDVTKKKLDSYKESGVTRISIGTQSFDDEVLSFLGRRHTASDVYRAIDIVKKIGFDAFSLDLISSIPNVPKDVFRKSLQEAIRCEPSHVSIYNLSIEKGCVFHRQGLTCIDDDDALDMINMAANMLADAGFARYEISNYARRGFECLHNKAVWLGEDYIGLGPGAYSRERLIRRHNFEDIKRWREGVVNNREAEFSYSEMVSAYDDKLERFLTQIRLLQDGFKLPDWILDRGNKQKTLDVLVKMEILSHSDGVYKLTSRGTEVCDSVIKELL